MIECVFNDRKLGKVVRKYLSALAEEGRLSMEEDLIVTDDEALAAQRGDKKLLFLTDQAEQPSCISSVSLPCRREALADAILRCLTS